MTTIHLTDGTSEEYPRVKMRDGFAHCYERRDMSLDTDNFDSKLVYFTVMMLWLSLVMWQPTHHKVKSIPESQIEEVK